MPLFLEKQSFGRDIICRREGMFTQVPVESFKENIFSSMADEWFLITSGSPDSFNMMTAAWGSVGVMWRQPVFNIVVRHTRHTYSFLEKNPSFSCSFFPKEYRKALAFCGKYSGRDMDKVSGSSLKPVILENATAQPVITFEGASHVFCMDIASRTPLTPEQFKDTAIDDSFYPEKDYHTMYTGYIRSLYTAE